MKKHISSFYPFILLLLIISGCNIYSATSPMEETPGAIYKLNPDIDLDHFQLVDWRFDPNQMLLVKGMVAELGSSIPFDLALLDRLSGKINSFNITDPGTISTSGTTQGKNGLIIFTDYDGNIYKYEPGIQVKTRIAHGFNSKFSPDGKFIAFWENNNLKTFNIENSEIKTIYTFSSQVYIKNFEVSGITWKPDGQNIAFIVRWKDKNDHPYQSEIWLLDFNNSSIKKIFSSKYLDELNWAPEGNALAFLDIDITNHTSILKLISIEEFGICTIGAINLQADNFHNISWSPIGDVIAMRFNYEIYFVNIEKVFGAPLNELSCQ